MLLCQYLRACRIRIGDRCRLGIRVLEIALERRGMRGKPSLVAVEAAGRKYLFPLTQSGEIFPWVSIQAVPYTQRWFLGVANLRGGLYGGFASCELPLGHTRQKRDQEAGERERQSLEPLLANPAYPDYPSGHACLTGALTETLGRLYGSWDIDLTVAEAETLMQLLSSREAMT